MHQAFYRVLKLNLEEHKIILIEPVSIIMPQAAVTALFYSHEKNGFKI